jgi:hypothetical protein
LRGEPIEHTGGAWIKVTERCRLEPVRENLQEQRPWHMGWGGTAGQAAPARPQPVQIETAQMRDLALKSSGWVDVLHHAALPDRVARAGVAIR